MSAQESARSWRAPSFFPLWHEHPKPDYSPESLRYLIATLDLPALMDGEIIVVEEGAGDKVPAVVAEDSQHGPADHDGSLQAMLRVTRGIKREANNLSRSATPLQEGRPEREPTEGAQPGSPARAKQPRKRRKSISASILMTTTRTVPLLVCSIGNPGSTYANTLHSAGHTVLNRLAEHLGYPQFRKERGYGNGLISRPPIVGGTGDWTLWQSTSYMNESGRGVKGAYQAWSKQLPAGEEGKLVVVHDELEKPLGAVTLRATQGASAKGHNGIKSMLSTIGSIPFTRIGIGIGRPLSRQSDDVARYVLRKMTPAEKEKIESCIQDIVAKLRQVEEG